MNRTFQPSDYSGHLGTNEYGELITITLVSIGALGAIGAGAFKYAGAKKIADAEGVSSSREQALAKEALKTQERVTQLQTLMAIKEERAVAESQQYLIKGVLTVAGLIGLAYVGLKTLQSDPEGSVDTEE
jgi:hypothetical protein